MVGSLVYHLIEDTPINICVLTEARLINKNIYTLHFDDALPYLITGFNTVSTRFSKHCEKVFGEKVSESLIRASICQFIWGTRMVSQNDVRYDIQLTFITSATLLVL